MSAEKDHAYRPRRNILWQEQPLPAPCEHQYEANSDDKGFAFRHCTKCGTQETK